MEFANIQVTGKEQILGGLILLRKEIGFMTQQEVVAKLEHQGLLEQYGKLRDYERRLFLKFCTGQSMTLLTYDSIFKFIFQSDGSYQRLEHFLSAMLGFEVQVEEVLPLEGSRVVRNGGVLYLDIIAKTRDNRIINVEMQKYPYHFCGERESCYLADMIMRQYNQRVSEAKKADRDFRYKDMRPVYMIILLENSYYDFQRMKDCWRHDGKVCFNTGIQLNYLPFITYITLDNFRNIEHNIDTEQKKWVYLFSADTPQQVSSAAAMSEEFFEIVRDVARFCMDVGEVFGMFSEALRIMDQNEEELMYAEAMEELSQTKEKLDRTESRLSDTESRLVLTQKICRLAMQGKNVTEIAEQCQITVEEVEQLLG